MLINSHLSVMVYDLEKKYGDREVLIYKDYGGKEWKSMNYHQFADKVKLVSNALLNIGAKKNENIGIFSQNSIDYIFSDFGAWGIRCTTVPFYATSSEEQIQFMIADAGIRFIFVSGQEQYDKARRVLQMGAGLERIIIFDRRVKISDKDAYAVYFDDFLALGKGYPRQAEVLQLQKGASFDELACILYTSGTTGNSKGVMLTHGQFHAAFKGNDENLPVTDKDRVLDFLPFTHIFEKAWALLSIGEGARMIVLTDPHEVQQAMRETNPTCMSSVPRFWEKVYAGVQEQIDSASPVKKALFHRALKVGKKHNIDYLAKGKRPPLGLAAEYNLYNKTVFSLVRKALGLTNPNFFPTAGAAVSPEVEEFIISIGIFMMAGYGLTESLATVSNVHKGEPFTVGSIGIPITSIDIKFSDEGEILLKGPTITPGYYNRPDLNRQAFTEDGYFRTGDVGYMKNGELYMTERIKDLFKTSNGKYIAPQMVESKILVDKYVEQLTIIADQRQFVSALIVPNFDLLEKYAQEKGLSCSTREELCSNKEIHEMLAERIDTLQQSLANYEKIKRFTLLPRHFTAERGELTSTLKIKRRAVAKNYSKEIDLMYK